jgi:hypothetical protein
MSSSSSIESSSLLYEELVLAHPAPYLYDAILTVQGLGGSLVRLTYDIRAKCKWDRVLSYDDVAALRAALDDIKTLARKSLRPRVPAKAYIQHILDIEAFIINLSPDPAAASSAFESVSSAEEEISSAVPESVSSAEEEISSAIPEELSSASASA